jgi:hypothetical protein
MGLRREDTYHDAVRKSAIPEGDRRSDTCRHDEELASNTPSAAARKSLSDLICSFCKRRNARGAQNFTAHDSPT